MNISDVEKKLWAAARAHRPSDAVPYAFEKRVMVRLARPMVVDLWGLWSRQFWRAAVPCLALTVVLGGVAFYSASMPSGVALQSDIEDTMLAAIEQGGENW